MRITNIDKRFTSRYELKKALGEYPPWQGFSVRDSLSEKDYLLFSLRSTAGTALSLDDLRMRDQLFSRDGGIIQATQSLQNYNGQNTFLQNHAELVPLTKALPSMKPLKSLEMLKRIVSNIVIRLRSGLLFYNLTATSVVLIGDSLRILPTAYLLPGEFLENLAFTRFYKAGNSPRPLYAELRSIGDIITIFSRYLEPETAKAVKDLARILSALGPDTNRIDIDKGLHKLDSLAVGGVTDSYMLAGREPPYIAPKAAIASFKQAAAKALIGDRQLLIVRGVRGEGKTRFLEEIAGKLISEWGFKEGTVIGDQDLFRDMNGKGNFGDIEFMMIDDHSLELLLGSYVVDRISQGMERCKLIGVAVNEKVPRHLITVLLEEARRKEISVIEISLPSCTKTEKRRIISNLLPTSAARNLKTAIDTSKPIALIKLETEASLRSGKVSGKRDQRSFLDELSPEERSILNFLAVFRFEAPLSFLKSVYPTEESGIYGSLQRLISRGLVRTRAEHSLLGDGILCLVYSLSGGGLSAEILGKIPDGRRKQLHSNITILLREGINTPLLYLFYHVVKSGEMVEAASMGYGILRQLLDTKRRCAIKCFNETYLGESLDGHLPPEARFKLLIELGNYFSLTGEMGKAENFYRRCRGEASKEENQEFRSLAVEAIRSESEILEKRGKFLKAEKLLKKALKIHGDHLLSHERAKLYNDLAWIHYRLGKFDKSWDNCLLVHKLLDDKLHPNEIAQAYNLMGTINWNRSKYDEAVAFHKKCLSLREETGDEIGIAASFNNLALVYQSMGRYKDALECYRNSMEIKKRHNNRQGLAACNLNMALAYLDMENLEEAEKNCLTAIRLADEIGSQQLLAEASGTMGEIHFLLGEFEKARDYYSRDLKICRETKSQREMAVVLRRLGDLRLAEGNLTEASELLQQARLLNRKIGSRLEASLLNLLDGRLLLADGRREAGRQKLEGASLELSLMGRKNCAAALAAEIGSQYLEEGNEVLAREFLLRGISILEEGEILPCQVKRLKETLDQRSPLSQGQIKSDSDRIKVLCCITSLIRTTSDPERLYREILDIARKISGMERTALILKGGPDDSYRVLSQTGGLASGGRIIDKDVLAVLDMSRRLGYPLDVSRTRIPEGNVSEEFLAGHPGIMCMMLRVQDEVGGFLYMDSTRDRGPTSDEERRFLVAISQQIAMNLEKTLLSEKFEQLKKSRQIVKPVPPRIKERVDFQHLVGNSSAMKHIRDLIDGIRDMDTTVLLTGRSGTGKDVVAKRIHNSGPRSNKPFVPLNCTTIPPDLLESELFGHERGAFTGAHRQRIGHFESANGGTIFLNEIGDMPLLLQPKLLRVLEEQKFYRLGGTTEISTDVRIIAATNQDLTKLVRQGRFREDLYYRINIFPIRIPSLKERREDIKSLCDHFISMYCRLYNKPIKKISPETMAYLANYDWPGNVRELENTINRLIIISKKDIILPEDLPQKVIKQPKHLQVSTRATLEEAVASLLDGMELSSSDPILPKVKSVIIKEMVDRLGDKKKAAAMLGISKPTLYNWLREYDKKKR